MTSRPIFAIVALVLVTAGMGYGLRAERAFAAAPAQATALHLYSPFGPGGGLARGVRVAKTVKGYCWSTSNVDARSDAYRCFVGNYIHDPCFANFYGAKVVVCPKSFPGSKVIRIRLTKNLPRGTAVVDPTRHPAWAIRLTDRRWCVALDGATGTVAGIGMTYGCVGGGLLLGEPRRRSATWTIFYANHSNSSSYVTVAIRSAWW